MTEHPLGWRGRPEPVTFPSVEEFCAADCRRRLSGEADYGVHWRGDPRRPWPTWRVSYVRDTGEVYAVQHGGPVEILGVLAPDDQPYYYATLDVALRGWEHAHSQGLDWVRERLTASEVA